MVTKLKHYQMVHACMLGYWEVHFTSQYPSMQWPNEQLIAHMLMMPNLLFQATAGCITRRE